MMQFIKTVARHVIILCLPLYGLSQSTYLPQDSKHDHFLDRLEILFQTNPDLNLSTSKPITRQLAVQVSELADSLNKFFPYDYFYHLSHTDQDNLQHLLMNNSEWVTGSKESFNSKKPVWNSFYKTKANFIEVHEKDFFLDVNPVIEQNQSIETGNHQRVYLNTKGLNFRGQIADHLGFSAEITDNQERGPGYFQDRVNATGFPAVPGAGYYKPFKAGTAFDYFLATGSINVDFWKYFSAQFGYDRNFIGNGYRSLFLSDYSAPYLFLKLNTKIWKFKYDILFMQLKSQHQLGDFEYPNKFAVVHHLSFNAAKWLNIGLYDNVVFSRANYFDFSYLNPVIFLVAAQQENGSPDKTTVGFDFKANLGHTVQFYGQVLFNEFVLHQIIHYSDGNWVNKQGLQLGLKYINAFEVKNLDLQFETNIVRPYVYTHDDSVSNYSNYNQPLAHPLGANFIEFIGIAKYQPSYKWNFELKGIYYKQGLDSAGLNFGNNIFLNYNTRPRDNGFKIGSGIKSNVFNISGLVSYELKENLFIDLSAMYRSSKRSDPVTPMSVSSSTFTLGVRLNMFRRQYDY